MCGINGYFSINKNINIDVASMNKEVTHRGPDYAGTYKDERHNLGFGHTRLSILDLDERSHQPFIEDDIVLTFNGEIYNFNQLKEQYLSDVEFRTTSDTEVIIHLYKKIGLQEMLKVMNGMFAFGLLDKTANKLFVCRDRIGKKPIYYSLDDEKLVFASEAKSFKGIKDIVIDKEVINDALYNRFSKQLSPFEGIQFLENGHYLEVELETFEVIKTEYFRFEDLIDEKEYQRLNSMKTEQIVDELERLLAESIDLRLISDVEVGTINSGGLDSSLVSAMILEKSNLRMFHIDVEGDSERQYAEILAKKLGVKMDVEVLKKDAFKHHIDQVIRHYEYPLVHPNAFGIFLLSELANSKKVRVLLSGDGADEIFGGYDYYKNYYRSLKTPSWIKKIVNKLNNYCKPVILPNIYSEAIFDSQERIDRIEKKYHFIKDAAERKTQAVLVSSLSEYLQPLNIRADKLGMANSVEFRSPFLDINLMKFAVNLPLKYKLNRSEGKIILKKMAERKLPKSLIYRVKMGFPVPLIDVANVNKHCGTHQNYVLYSEGVLRDLNSN